MPPRRSKHLHFGQPKGFIRSQSREKISIKLVHEKDGRLIVDGP
jgi:hypothetical protein